MSAKSILAWSAAVFMGLAVAHGVRPVDAPVITLATGLGPTVTVEPL